LVNLLKRCLVLINSCCVSVSEYQLESESRSPCELLRSVGSEQQNEHIPQCSEDGRYRYVQCNRGGECWCVNSDGTEIPGSRQNDTVVTCLTPCQLQRQRLLLSGDAGVVPRCLDSGEYEPVQCDGALGQCWCVDMEGMEIYGTRQNGRPSQCPSVCETRQRRLLHGVGESSPPQCSDNGRFLPVQCKFINTTNMMVFDLLHAFNRRPEVFQTFSGFRKAYPELSSYCYCADTRGRELPSTGLELLLDEVYDTAFSGLDVGRSFSQTNMYRILQRRFFAVQLALTGRFRCPTPCESERSASSQAGNVYVPSCDARGQYLPSQCQAGGQCWCVDSDGKEIFGTRQRGVPDCGKDCYSERRLALSRLFYGPAGHLSQNNAFSSPQDTTKKDASPFSPCSPEFQELLANSGLTRSLPESERSDIGEIMAELVQGMFPTGALALKALSLTSNPKRLQENLFGGKFLKNAGNFNFTGTVGSRGTVSFSQAFLQVGLSQDAKDLTKLAKIFSVDSTGPNLDREVSDAYGRSVNLQRNRDLIKLIGRALENEQFFTTLREAITLLKAEDSDQLGPLFQAVFQNFDVCSSPASPSSLYLPQCTEDGQYQAVQCQGSECWCADSQGQEVMGSRSIGYRPRCPSRCEKERMMAIAVKASSSAGSEVFIPKCEEDGEYVSLQCLGKSCFCLDQRGVRYSTLVGYACPTDCQITASQYFMNTVNSLLASSSSVSQLSDVYVPRCASDGSWHQIQCDGPPEQAFDFYQEWIQINNDGKELPVSDLLGIPKDYAKNTEAMASFRGFLSAVFQARHQKVFPALAKYEAFSELPSEILDGNTQAVSGPSVFLNPLYLWKLLRGDSSQYPGPLADFSAPLNHFDLRQCWCVDQTGGMIAGSKAPVNQIPKCPGPCSLIKGQVDEFLAKAERQISLSNSSYIPVGYSFLLAESVNLISEAMQQTFSTGFQVSEDFLSNTDSALRLAAHSTLHFYWQSRLLASETDRESLRLGYQPYSPQCDAYGQWLPTQCYPSTGRCWCVDEEGGYITGSLTDRTVYLPQCKLLFDIVQACVLMYLGPGWCALQKKLVAEREMGVGYEPQCVEGGERFSPLLCDASYCWCVSESGQELPATRTTRSLGKTPSCDYPQCPLPFGDSVSHGAAVCGNESVAGEQRQRCRVYCQQGYLNTLQVDSFSCDPVTKTWISDAPLSYACQRVQPLQTVRVSSVLQLTLAAGQQGCSGQRSALQASLLHDLRVAGLCSLQVLSSTAFMCDNSSVLLECESEQSLTATITLKARLSDLPISALPDLYDIDSVFSSEKILKGVMEIIRSGSYRSVYVSEPTVAISSPASFSCSVGYQQLPDSAGCVVCPAGSFSSGGRCDVCPRGSYQAEAGQDFCSPCPSGTSTAAPGASSPSHCLSECQQSKLSCTDRGEFLSAQKHFQSGKWLCITSKGEELTWTSADEANLEKKKVIFGLFGVFGRIYMPNQKSEKHEKNVFLSLFIPGPKKFERLTFHKASSGVYRTLVFEASGASLADVHRFCVDTCRQESCCDGFILNQNVLNGGSLMCGLLSFPSVLQCSEGDWDVSSVASSNRICGAGLKYNKQQKQFTFEFGGQNFTINSVKEMFDILSGGDISINSDKKTPTQQYWLFKHQFTAEEARLWCLKRCMEEELCHVADLRDEGSVYSVCMLYPDTRVCGAYDKPLRQACSLVLPQDPQTAYRKKGESSICTKKAYLLCLMNIASHLLPVCVLSRFLECERRCDEDPCCRGIGYIRDTGTAGRNVSCLTLNSLGIQTCGEDDRTEWRVQDCSPSKVQTGLHPFGWYEKPGRCAICIAAVRATRSTYYFPLNLKDWTLLNASSILVDSSVSAFDIVHLSKDIAEDLDRGGSTFSPAAVMSKRKAQEQAASLSTELGCSSSEPSQILTCLRGKTAQSINAAQTKLLAVSGPLQAWSPVVDGAVVREDPTTALNSGRFYKVPLLLGSSAEDGLISRAKNIKNFELLQGRADSKTAFYEALSNSLGGDDANAFVKEAATWFYSLQHSPTPSGYNVFSRALENATRDYFITCPSVNMASFWASHTRSSVYMYHLPQDMAHNSADLSAPLDIQYVFGVPHSPAMRELFTYTERKLSLQVMSYVANFIKTGYLNPNLPVSVSTTSFGEVLPPWPQFLPHPNGQSYKELSPSLSNRNSLQSAQCSFWSQYVPALSASTALAAFFCPQSFSQYVII
uniref:Thyroglobulin n=1 Tax=Astyanax mexicanus TaxID=7994 RepID=A0A8B9L637_ASTMX